jgi:hypothetical protein
MSTATAAPTNPVVTTKVTGRRVLRFTSLDDILKDAQQLTTGRARRLGNWSLGQATGHLACAMKMSLDGTNHGRAPLPVRIILRLFFKKLILTKGMRPGFNLKGKFAQYMIPEATCSNEQGLSDLRAGIERLKREPQRHPHPAFGPLTREEWDQLHLRHAELHLSFFVPE